MEKTKKNAIMTFSRSFVDSETIFQKMWNCWRKVRTTLRKWPIFHEWGILKTKSNSEATNLHHFFSWLQIRTQKYTLQGQMTSYEESGFFKKSVFFSIFFPFGGLYFPFGRPYEWPACRMANVNFLFSGTAPSTLRMSGDDDALAHSWLGAR